MSDINDTLRELLQKITGLKDRQDRQESHYHSYHELFVNDGWIPDTKTWTRASDTTMTLVGDYTTQFPVGAKLKVTDSTVKYFSVVSATYGAPNTTVTFTGGSDYVLAASPTVEYYSYTECPVGFPGWFNYTVAWTCATTPPALNNGTLAGRFMKLGRLTIARIDLTTGNTTTFGTGAFRFSLPTTVSSTIRATGICYAYDGSGTLYYPGFAIPIQSVAYAQCYYTAVMLVTHPFAWASVDVLRIQVEYED